MNHSEIVALKESHAQVFASIEHVPETPIRISITSNDLSVNTTFRLDVASAQKLAWAILRGVDFVSKQKQAEEV